MIKQISKPNIKFNFDIYDDDKFYYNDITKQYFIINNSLGKYYFNLNGNSHRDDGPTWPEYELFYLNKIGYHTIDFAMKTSHLICKYCKKFCKQRCF